MKVALSSILVLAANGFFLGADAKNAAQLEQERKRAPALGRQSTPSELTHVRGLKSSKEPKSKSESKSKSKSKEGGKKCPKYFEETFTETGDDNQFDLGGGGDFTAGFLIVFDGNQLFAEDGTLIGGVQGTCTNLQTELNLYCTTTMSFTDYGDIVLVGSFGNLVSVGRDVLPA